MMVEVLILSCEPGQPWPPNASSELAVGAGPPPNLRNIKIESDLKGMASNLI